jgi:hypothetical protein
MPGIKRLKLDSRESRVSQASTAAVSPFAQAPPGPRSNQTGRLFDQDLAATGGPFSQRSDWFDFVTRNGNYFDPGLAYSFLPINSTQVEQRTFSSPFVEPASHIDLSHHPYGGRSNTSGSEISWSDYQPSAQKGGQYRQGGRQADETQSHDIQFVPSGTWVTTQRKIDQGSYM